MQKVLNQMSGNLQKDNNSIELDTIEDAIAAIKAGEVIIVVDDEDRENEGDFICAAECITPEIINFMATHGRGLICTPLDEKRADELDLPYMVQSNTALHETAFTVSIDLIGRGCSTGISAYDRSTGIRAIVDPSITAKDFARPGHIFPLRAKTGGVLRRTGHTEAAIDLAQLAGFSSVGVLVEILNEDGTMARLPQLVDIAKKHNLKLISIKDLVAYRMRTERLVQRIKDMELQTRFGNFRVIAFKQATTEDVHLAFVKGGNWSEDEPVMVRVHSGMESSSLLHMMLGERDANLEKALQKIDEAGKGVLLYMRHSEKDDDIIRTLSVLEEKQQNGDSAHEIKKQLDQRDFGIGAQILHDLGLRKIKIITNNPKKRIGLIGYDLEIVENIQL